MSNGTTAETPPRARLYAALAKAQAACRAAELDGRFDGGKVKYPYSSIDARLDVAREALGANGLALVRVGMPKLDQLTFQREVVDPQTAEIRLEPVPGCLLLEQAFALVHESGEVLETGFRWPVIPEDRFRPLDKALAGAHSSGLSYLVRDVLLMRSEADANEAAHAPLPPPPLSRPAPTNAQVPARPPAPPATTAAPAATPPMPPAIAASTPASPSPAAPPGEPAAAAPPAASAPSPAKESQPLTSMSLTAYMAAVEKAKRVLAAAPIASTKLYAIQPDVQDRALYLDIFGVAEKALTRDGAIATLKELGVAQGAVPTVEQLRKFVDRLP